MIWKMFVENFNGTSFILDDTWLSIFDMQLFTDSTGGCLLKYQHDTTQLATVK
jgi:hypothetical protein